MKNQKQTDGQSPQEFDFWEFIEKHHPLGSDYPHQDELDDLRQFFQIISDIRQLQTTQGSEVVGRVLQQHGNTYEARAYYSLLESQLYVEAYQEYFLSQKL